MTSLSASCCGPTPRNTEIFICFVILIKTTVKFVKCRIVCTNERRKYKGTDITSWTANKVVHIMLTMFTIMLILYAQKVPLLCSKSPTIMLKKIFQDH